MSTPHEGETAESRAAEQAFQAEGREKLKHEIDRYAQLMIKADRGRLTGDELDLLMVTAINMKKRAWTLGIPHGQLKLMLWRKMDFLKLDIGTPPSSAL